MEYELENKKFFISDFYNKEEMNNEIDKYMVELKNKYRNAIVTKEFYKNNGILVRATQINSPYKDSKISKEKEEELEKEEVRIKEKGINGLGQNVYSENKNGKTREKEIGHTGGNERERGGR